MEPITASYPPSCLIGLFSIHLAIRKEAEQKSELNIKALQQEFDHQLGDHADVVVFGIAKLLKTFSATAPTESLTETQAAASTGA